MNSSQTTRKDRMPLAQWQISILKFSIFTCLMAITGKDSAHAGYLLVQKQPQIEALLPFASAPASTETKVRVSPFVPPKEQAAELFQIYLDHTWPTASLNPRYNTSLSELENLNHAMARFPDLQWVWVSDWMQDVHCYLELKFQGGDLRAQSLALGKNFPRAQELLDASPTSSEDTFGMFHEGQKAHYRSLNQKEASRFWNCHQSFSEFLFSKLSPPQASYWDQYGLWETPETRSGLDDIVVSEFLPESAIFSSIWSALTLDFRGADDLTRFYRASSESSTFLPDESFLSWRTSSSRVAHFDEYVWFFQEKYQKSIPLEDLQGSWSDPSKIAKLRAALVKWDRDSSNREKYQFPLLPEPGRGVDDIDHYLDQLTLLEVRAHHSNHALIYRVTRGLKTWSDQLALDFPLSFSKDESDRDWNVQAFPIKSLSYGTSMTAGCVDDPSACLHWYVDKKDKILYAVKIDKNEFYSHGESAKLFDVPPLTPTLGLFSVGEYFHTRSRIPSLGARGTDSFLLPGVGFGELRDVFRLGLILQPELDSLTFALHLSRYLQTHSIILLSDKGSSEALLAGQAEFNAPPRFEFLLELLGGETEKGLLARAIVFSGLMGRDHPELQVAMIQTALRSSQPSYNMRQALTRIAPLTDPALDMILSQMERLPELTSEQRGSFIQNFVGKIYPAVHSTLGTPHAPDDTSSVFKRRYYNAFEHLITHFPEWKQIDAEACAPQGAYAGAFFIDLLRLGRIPVLDVSWAHFMIQNQLHPSFQRTGTDGFWIESFSSEEKEQLSRFIDSARELSPSFKAAFDSGVRAKSTSSH